MYFPLKMVSPTTFPPPLPPRTLPGRSAEVGYVTTKCPKARFLLDLIDNWDLPRCGTRTMQRWNFFPNKGGPKSPVICRFVLKVLTGINGSKYMATWSGGSKNPYSFHMEGENILEKERGGFRLEKGIQLLDFRGSYSRGSYSSCITYQICSKLIVSWLKSHS